MNDRVSSAVRRWSTSLRRPWGGARGPDEPPVVRGWMPFLGCALPFGRDAPAFLRRCQRRHGDAFTVYLMGRRMTFLLDARDYPEVFKHPEALSFRPIAEEISTRAFGYESLYRSTLATEQLSFGYHEHLRPGAMGPLAERTQRELSRALDERVRALPQGDDRWRQAELFELVSGSVFEAGTIAMFGEGAYDESIRRRFMGFDGHFHRLVAGVPLRLLGTTREDRQALVDRLRSVWPAASRFIAERHARLREHIDEQETARVHLSMLWASQANTVPAAFWALALLLEDAEGLGVVRDEVDSVVERGSDGVARFGPAALRQLRYLDSAISESLRLCSGATTIRAVLEPVCLELTSGRRCALRRGDNVCLFPFLSHRDPEIFEEPDRYRFDRFYAARGSRRFEKEGQRLGFALMPFGGGETMCPGRFLALSEIKMLVAMVLADYEVERAAEQVRPAFDLARAGLGILPPMGPLTVRLRSRLAA